MGRLGFKCDDCRIEVIETDHTLDWRARSQARHVGWSFNYSTPKGRFIAHCPQCTHEAAA